ncbi:MAG TPA: hypothetical protein VGC86_15570 [Afipia sp.]
MKTAFNKIALAASLALPMFAVASVAYAAPITSDARTFPRPVQTSSVYDAQASMDVPVIVSGNSRAYQGGPKNGTGFSR